MDPNFNFNFHLNFTEYNRSKTTAELIQELTSSEKSSRGKLIVIEALVIFGAIVFSLLLVLGSYRRRSNSPLAKFILWTASTLNYPVVSYTIGLMQSFPSNDKGNLFAIWAIFLIIVYGSADSFSVYSLDDHEHWKREFVLQNIQLFWVGSLMGFSILVDERLMIPIWSLYILGSLKRNQRLLCSLYASLSFKLKEVDKLVADYMAYEHTNPDEVDPKHMNGYHYLVTGEDKEECTIGPDSSYKRKLDIRRSHKVVTVAKIWQCNGRLLQEWGDPKGGLKDLCLSFALFKLLRRRYSGYSFYEAHLHKTRDFVLRGLLTDDDHERAFRVIEVELAFLFDFFYTKYPIVFSNGYMDLIYSALVFIPSYWIAELISSKRNQDIGATFTVVVVLVILALVFVQLLVYVSSDWAKVWLLCQYAKRASWQNSPRVEKLLGFVCRQPRAWATWQNKLGQYSLLESFSFKPSNILNRVTYDLVDKERPGQKKGDPAELSAQVKKAVAESAKRILSDLLTLPSNDARLTNGLQSLRRNGVSNALYWACETETHTQMILFWHIATHFCEIAASGSNHVRDEEIARNCEVSSSLSRYCAYLVAFVPELLPDHTRTTEDIFDKVVTEAKDFFSETNCLRQMFHKMNRFGESVFWSSFFAEREVSSCTILVQGIILGKFLMDAIPEEGRRWKLLADFWAELILFLAPSDNAKAHIENLANGGEFITHIWALLSHAGIMERGPIPPSTA